jgi:NitT/TauT family transport system ATP-binding protein
MMEALGVHLWNEAGLPLLRLPDCKLMSGEAWWILGPSGSGKSQLLRLAAGLRTPDAGVLERRAKRVGLASRTASLLANLSLKDNLMLPLRFEGLPRSQADARAEAALERFGIAASGRLRPHLLGERARKLGLFARVWAWEPELVLVDEPHEDLDAEDEALVDEALEAWRSQGKALVVVTERGAAPEGWRRFRLQAGTMVEV